MILLSATSLAFAVAMAQQSVPPAPPADPVTRLEDVVVDGRRLREAVDDFVDEIVAPPVNYGPARWHRRVCVGAVNFRGEIAQALVDQVSSVALLAGLEIGEPGCRPNILIMGTDDGGALARGLVEGTPRAFRPFYSGAARSSEALERFQNSSAPVRWWHVSMPVVRATGQPGVRMPLDERYPIFAGEGLLRTPLRNDLLRAFVIVDGTVAEGVDLRHLGDYIGMVALAQIDPDTDTSSYDTVLNLFGIPSQSELALTDWDRSYLQALYGAELNQRAVNQQGGEVSSSMFRDRRQAQTEDEEPPPTEPNPGP